jgi:hypothetical protein
MPKIREDIMTVCRLLIFLFVLLLILGLFLTTCTHSEKQDNKNITIKSYYVIRGDGNWPSFRGDHAAGVADGQNLPDKWGPASSPIIYRDMVLVQPGLN